MRYRVRAPSEPLRPFVDHLWFFDDLVAAHDRERVLPDGTCEFIVNLSPEPRKLFDRDEPARFTPFRRGWLSGTHSRFLVIDMLPGSSLIGVHFRPGGIAPFVPMPAGEIAENVFEFDGVWGAHVIALRDALLEQPTIEAKFDHFEKFLLRLGRGKLGGDPAVRYALARFEQQPHTAAISDVAGELGWSHKHFIDRFRDAVGLTPKRFCRIRRFQAALRQISRAQPVEWIRLAHDGGFADQAHFVHEFQAFSGINPSAYLTQSGEYMNFVPIP